MAEVYLSLGSNIGEKEQNILFAVDLLRQKVGKCVKISKFYETEPWGFKSENLFLNAAVLFETALQPLELLQITQQIEHDLGRRKKQSNGKYFDRIIDIDILLYDKEIIDFPELKIPHPLMHKRAFVLAPLAEIAPEAVHPVLNKTVKALYAELYPSSSL